MLEAVGQFQEGMTAGAASFRRHDLRQLESVGVLAAATLFGYTQALQTNCCWPASPSPRQFISMLPYVVTIVAVSGFVGRVRPPAAEGKVYETEGSSE